MTGRTRDYLADLANRKGVKLPGEQEREQAWASAKIDELNKLDDKDYSELAPEQSLRILNRIDKIVSGMNAWTFEA